MNLKNVLTVSLLAATVFIAGCKKDNEPAIPNGTGKNTLEVTFAAKANGKTFNLNDSFDLTTEGFNYTFNILKFYVSQFRLVKNDNSTVLVKDIDMIDFRTDAPHVSFKAEIPEGDYKEIKFGIGVDSANNHRLPNSFPVDHPLASSKGMYWSMINYRFMIMEGRLDTTAADSLYNVPFGVHTGTDELYREKTFAHALKFLKGDDKKITIELDVDKLLTGLNFKTDHVSHSEGPGFPLAEKVADNFVNNLSVK